MSGIFRYGKLGVELEKVYRDEMNDMVVQIEGEKRIDTRP